MGRTVAYLRASTDKQDLNNQKLEILEFARQKDLRVDEFIAITVSSRKTSKQRRIDELLEKLSLNGIESRPVFYPLHQMPPYRDLVPSEASFPVAERISRTGISLPCSCRLKSEEIQHVCETITRVLRVREACVHDC